MRPRKQQAQSLNLCTSFKPRILIVEAGPQLSWFQRKLSDIPLTGSLLFGMGVDRVYQTLLQTAASRQLKKQELLLPTGRMVGGTAMLNAMLFSFGHPEDETFRLFNQWNPRFFSELFQEPGHAVTECHFTPAPNYRHHLNEKFHVALSEVFKSLGLPVRDSPDGWVKEGLQTPLVFVQKYQRWSSYTSCLEPLLKHKDAQITILPETLVEKVLFDPYKPGFVKGVIVVHKSAKFPIWLSNASEVNPMHPIPEVILSAGTFESPAILLRSGIGMESKPQTTDYVTPNNITSLPVGSNFHDHPMIGLVCTFQKPVAINTKVVTPLEMLRYFWSGKSAASQAGAITSIAYLRTSLQRIQNSSKPDIQFTFIAAAVFEQEIFQKLGHFTQDTWQKFLPPRGHDMKNTVIVLVTLLQPYSRGRVTLHQTSPQPFPSIRVDPAYLTAPQDLDRLVEGVSWLYSVLTNHDVLVSAIDLPSAQPPLLNSPQSLGQLGELGLTFHLPQYTNCPPLPPHDSTKQSPSSRTKWKLFFTCLVQSVTMSNYHYVGTCPATNNSNAVVSDKLLVLGTKNLRVADASVIPVVPTSNPVTYVMAAGNHAAQSILQRYWDQIEHDGLELHG
ncbi:hypothetical protein CRM22_002110 [Opisthorchis felineus]|nr:hypothetical protein CRM22_002110 [Opisthorchis felineus]